MDVKRGDLYFVKNTYQIGREQRGDRPAVIISNDVGNEHSGTVIVCMLTTQPKKDLPTHCETNSSLRPSTILCEQMKTIDKERLDTYIGRLSEDEMEKLDECLKVSLDLFGTSVKDNAAQIEELNEALVAANKKIDLYKDMYEHLMSIVTA